MIMVIKYSVYADASREGKREPGANPGRTRHCNRREFRQNHWSESFGKGRKSFEPEVRKPVCI